MKDLRQKLLATFQIEHRDHVEQIRSLLSSIEGAPGPELDEALRRAHSLKGAARAVDLSSVENLSHRLETLFSRVRQGEMRFSPGLARVVGEALDASEDCVAALDKGHPAPDVASALASLNRALGGTEPETAPAPAPSLQPGVSFQPLETIRIALGSFDGLFRSAGGLLSESRRQTDVTGQLDHLAQGLAVLEKQFSSTRRSSSLTSGFDSMERQLRLLSRQAAAARDSQKRSTWRLHRLGDQLEHDVRLARMAPAENLVEGHRRMMRDLARDQAKEIEFRSASTATLADRRVLDALKDPLLHLLRNAVSHGIESPRERAAKRKPAAGTVSLGIASEGQRLIITVEDDGRGIDFSRVTEVAASQGLISAHSEESLSRHELTGLLFRPGFTTAAAVTSLSGRGMGLSVADESVRRLGGEASIVPRPGGGTIARLSVPLSIATHRLLIARCAAQAFAIPIHHIESLHRLDLNRIENSEGRPMIALDGGTVPVLSLSRLLDLGDATAPENGNLMILRSGDTKAALIVDGLLGELETVMQDLGPATPAGGKISGAVLLDDDSVAFVVSVARLLQSPEHTRLLPAAPPAQSAPQHTPAAVSILVVDDSITTRTLERSILEAYGYKVQVAVDGIEGLSLLRVAKPDLVISDVQMPRLDGFGMLEQMKRDPELAGIPVIMVTSLERREDRERGMSLGADAYIVKRKFDQAELLSAIRQIVQ